MRKIKVLYIDDENDNLLAFQSSFRRNFDVFIAVNTVVAREILEKHPIEVIIADNRMPSETGVEFFEAIITTYPNPTRIILTGYSDIQSVEDSINKGHVYNFIHKPWNDIELKLTIENAFNFYHLREQNNALTNKYITIYNESTDAILLIDENSNLVNFNTATVDLFETVNPHLDLTVFTENLIDTENVNFIKNELCKEGFIENYELKINLLRGIRKMCLLSANKISYNNGETDHFQFIIRDITKRHNTQQLMIKTAITAQDMERERITKELQEEIGINLVGIKMQLDYLKENIQKEHKVFLDNVSENIINTIKQLRFICNDLLPPGLSTNDIQQVITELCENNSSDNFEINCLFKTKLQFFDKNLGITIFRIIQEFIKCSSVHSISTIVNIYFVQKNDVLKIKLSNNGIGLDINKYDNDTGLGSIIYRVKSFQGNIQLSNNKNSGTKIIIKFPILAEYCKETEIETEINND